MKTKQISDSSSEYSNEDSDNSDAELQEAFAKGQLKPGINVEVAPKQIHINNEAGLKRKLEHLKNNLPWVERFDLTNDPAPHNQETMVADEDNVNDDFKRELRFYRQAQASALQGIPKIQTLGIPTKRPEDYFAEMAKSDVHMKKVREKLMEKKTEIEGREKARKLRDLRKYGKKVQQEVLQKRQKEKKEMLDAVKKFRRGQKDKLDFLNEMEDKPRKKGSQQTGGQKENKASKTNHKREYKNKKFGFGGQKKRGKSNTADSSADMSEFSIKINQGRPGFNKKKDGGKKPQRVGKSRRQQQKTKSKHR